MNYIKRLIDEDKLMSLRNWIEKHIPDCKVYFNSGLYLHINVKNKGSKKNNFFVLTNYSCRMTEAEKLSKQQKVLQLKVENCFISFMTETFPDYYKDFLYYAESSELDCKIPQCDQFV